MIKASTVFDQERVAVAFITRTITITDCQCAIPRHGRARTRNPKRIVVTIGPHRDFRIRRVCRGEGCRGPVGDDHAVPTSFVAEVERSVGDSIERVGSGDDKRIAVCIIPDHLQGLARKAGTIGDHKSGVICITSNLQLVAVKDRVAPGYYHTRIIFDIQSAEEIHPAVIGDYQGGLVHHRDFLISHKE